jgi:thiol-disulfide isomerase/thioredoxin
VSQVAERSGKARRAVLVSLGIVFGILAGLLLLTGLDPSWLPFQIGNAPSANPAVPEVNSPAPDFSLQTLSGDTVTLSDYAGRVVLINYWATWCIPCRAEMPLLQKYADQYPDKLVVLAVNNGEREVDVEAFIREQDLTLPVLLDPDAAVSDLYRVRGFPTTMFIDRDGKIRYQHIGILSEDRLVAYLSELGIKE